MLKESLKEYLLKDSSLEYEFKHYDVKDLTFDEILDKVIDEGIEGFKYTLITPSVTSFHNHKIHTIEGIHLDMTNLHNHFIASLKEKFKRFYPEWVDRALNNYGNCFINHKTYKNSIKKLRDFYNFEEERFYPANESGTLDGYILVLKKEE